MQDETLAIKRSVQGKSLTSSRRNKEQWIRMSEAVPNWEAIVHKNARTSDRGDAGNVIEIEEDTITLERGPTAEYVIPKSMVEGYNGAEVSLAISWKELDQYKKR